MSDTNSTLSTTVVFPNAPVGNAVTRNEQQAFSCAVEEQVSDVRSLQFQCKIVFRNRGEGAVGLLFVRPLTPNGAELQEVIDSTQSDSRQALNNLYEDLNILLANFMIGSSDEYRNNIIKSSISYLKENLSVLGISRFYFNMLRFNMDSYAKRLTENRRAWTLHIRDSDRAQQYYDDLLAPCRESAKDLCTIFSAKIADAKKLEEELGNKNHSQSIAEIDPGEDFAISYLFNCKRSILNARTYTFSFECAAQEQLSSKTRYLSNSISTTISPKPLVLNLVAIFSAILGAFLKLGIDLNVANKSEHLVFTDAMIEHNFVEIATAMITALFFYNVYDSTEVGSKLRLGLGWRSALVIGGICGFLNERVVAALNGLLG